MTTRLTTARKLLFYTVCLVAILWLMPGASSADEPRTAATVASATVATPAAAEAPISTKSLWGIVREGGFVMLPLLACSFLLMVFTFERLVSLRSGRIMPGPFIKRLMHQIEEGQIDRAEALEVCQQNGSPIANVFAAAIKRWGRSAGEIEQALLDAGEREGHSLRRYLRVFNGVATVAPMLGLLGTVFGMIRAFNDIAVSDAMGRSEMFAKGISEALLATASGLAVAIPALVLYWVFLSMADRHLIRIDALGMRLVDLISADGIAERAKAGRKRSAA